MELYKMNKGTKLYIDDCIIIFDHIDGMYSYCWLENDRSKIVHINALTKFRKYKDGYKLKKENGDK